MFSFDNTYARLEARFYARLAPTPVAAPQLIKVNVELARGLGLDPRTETHDQGGRPIVLSRGKAIETLVG